MGLTLEVGILADLNEQDPAGAEKYARNFEALARYLASIGKPPHREPRRCEVWSADMYGYAGLHYLRRLAAHVDSGSELPEPGDDTSSGDPLVEAYGEAVLARPHRGVFARLFKRPQRFAQRFDHLILHSDAEGFYLPLQLDEVLFPPASFRIPGGMVGSSMSLLEELDTLASLLEVPEALDSQSEALWAAADNQGQGAELWQRYGVESYSCVVLREACRKSIELGAALVFT